MLVHLETEEAFTALRENADEEEKDVLAQLKPVVTDRGLSEAFIKELLKDVDVSGLREELDAFNKGIKHCLEEPPADLKRSVVTLYNRTQLLQLCYIITRRILLKLPAIPQVYMPPTEIRDHYPHTSVSEHAPHLVAEGKSHVPQQGTVFDRGDAKLFFEALENPDHKYRQRAIQAIRRFNTAVEKEKAQPHLPERGIVMQQASRKYGVPASMLRDWQDLGLIPVLSKGKGKQGVYLDEEAVARAASVYQEARQKDIQPTRLLKAELDQQPERHPQLDQGITASSASREFNVPTKFLLRWAKQLGVIPILSEGTGAGSATYLDREKAREVAELYHEAKRQRIQPKKLLERMSFG